jgi:hypothetical protein
MLNSILVLPELLMHTMAEQETNIHVIERDVDMLEMNRLDV